MIPSDPIVIGLVGLGYVGLPLAVAFGKTSHRTVGYDLNSKKIASLRERRDPNGELSPEMMHSTHVEFSDDPSILEQANILIAAIPTPVDEHNEPDLEPVKSASILIGQHLQPNSVVVFESTVYPGVTEEVCAPLIEQYSGLKFGADFTLGYSPERINPGDKEHTLETIVKIVSGSDESTLDLLARLYGEVVKAGIHRAPSIKIAEAAKVIENIQRDLNIALMNELSIIFRTMGIDTMEVLKAAETKWNFHSYRPGLVGGHCIGVDPYYLTHRAQQLGYASQVILAGRRINDGMAGVVANYVVQGLKRLGMEAENSRILILGLTFKENVGDTRNSKTVDLITTLKRAGVTVEAYDPFVSSEVAKKQFGTPLASLEGEARYDAMVLASPHDCILQKMDDILKLGKAPLYFIDIKGKLKGRDFEDSIHYETL